jgi:cytidine deaminase
VTDEQSACMPLGECRQLLVELQALRLRATALEETVARFVNAVDRGEDPASGGSAGDDTG